MSFGGAQPILHWMLAEIFCEIEFLNDLLKSRPTKISSRIVARRLLCRRQLAERVLMTLRAPLPKPRSPTYNAPAERARLRRRQPNTVSPGY